MTSLAESLLVSTSGLVSLRAFWRVLQGTGQARHVGARGGLLKLKGA